MTKPPRKKPAAPGGRSSAVRRQSAALTPVARFDEVLALIEAARRRAYQAVNTELVGLYWQLGEYISKKIASAQWGDGVVDALAATIAREYPGMRGYTRRNLFRMRQFYETYRGDEKVSALLTQLPWTHHLIILSQTKLPEERQFYMLAAINADWTSRELERQVRAQAFRRSELEPVKVSNGAVTNPSERPRELQERLLARVPRPAGRTLRSRPARSAPPQPWSLHHRAWPRLLLCRLSVPGAGGQPGLLDRRGRARGQRGAGSRGARGQVRGAGARGMGGRVEGEPRAGRAHLVELRYVARGRCV